MMNCEECIYFDLLPKGQTGVCNRWPPQARVYTGYDQISGSEYVSSAWAKPEVDPEDWCGEFSDNS
jgi:hypothetical protein